MRVIIITGTSSGLGKAIAIELLSDKNNAVLSISRLPNQKLQKDFPDRYFWLKTDLKDLLSDYYFNEFNKIVSKFNSIVFINNASIIEPIKKVGVLETNEIKNSLNINVFNPVLIINALIKWHVKKLTILAQIDSGAARMEIQNWSLYSSGKAFLFRFYKIIQEENMNISVHIIDPGMIDSNMQKTIRESDFPDSNKFITAFENEKLVTIDQAALGVLNHLFTQ